MQQAVTQKDFHRLSAEYFHKKAGKVKGPHKLLVMLEMSKYLTAAREHGLSFERVLKMTAFALQPYNYITHKPDYYTFITNGGCEYHCYFFDFSTAFLEYPDLAPKVFGFNLELKYKPRDKIIGLDKRIALTVAIIIKTFLNQKENVVVYICDTSDNHEKARYHKFTNWFKIYNDGNIIQLKSVIRAGNTNILNALLINKENKFLNEFIEAYEILTGIYTKPDEDELNTILNDPGW